MFQQSFGNTWKLLRFLHGLSDLSVTTFDGTVRIKITFPMKLTE